MHQAGRLAAQGRARFGVWICVWKKEGAITMDAMASTIGGLVVDQMQAQSIGKTAPGTASSNGSVSALYGNGGDVDALARQSMPSDAGKQFANMAGWNLALQDQGGAPGVAGGYVG